MWIWLWFALMFVLNVIRCRPVVLDYYLVKATWVLKQLCGVFGCGLSSPFPSPLEKTALPITGKVNPQAIAIKTSKTNHILIRVLVQTNWTSPVRTGQAMRSTLFSLFRKDSCNVSQLLKPRLTFKQKILQSVKLQQMQLFLEFRFPVICTQRI